ncbi:hypothetical protein [Pseudomonas canadensis]|uniref:hypothetical protein n=1 Tax=Pseudomonas canadensis TaxID=915099 RepID=UPI002736D350|nr:hypothetical protein [Pseudomonas canadensis]WLH27430.1 hypothetical protein PSH56_15255 [Pseudomonas canadensis]
MTIHIPRHTSPDCKFESLWLECPNRIGRGTGRDAYEIPGHPDKILKVSNRQSNFSNWMEILVYEQFKDRNELAEIFSWSWSGRFVVMERLIPLSEGDLCSYTFPYYLTDRKPENYGKDSSGKIKALDYAALAIDTPQDYFGSIT